MFYIFAIAISWAVSFVMSVHYAIGGLSFALDNEMHLGDMFTFAFWDQYLGSGAVLAALVIITTAVFAPSMFIMLFRGKGIYKDIREEKRLRREQRRRHQEEVHQDRRRRDEVDWFVKAFDDKLHLNNECMLAIANGAGAKDLMEIINNPKLPDYPSTECEVTHELETTESDIPEVLDGGAEIVVLEERREQKTLIETISSIAGEDEDRVLQKDSGDIPFFCLPSRTNISETTSQPDASHVLDRKIALSRAKTTETIRANVHDIRNRKIRAADAQDQSRKVRRALDRKERIRTLRRAQDEIELREFREALIASDREQEELREQRMLMIERIHAARATLLECIGSIQMSQDPQSTCEFHEFPTDSVYGEDGSVEEFGIEPIDIPRFVRG